MGTKILELANTLTSTTVLSKGKANVYFGVDVDEATDTSYKLSVEELEGSFGADGISGSELSADPSNPAEGNYVIWMSNGIGSGDDGDILIKITAGGVTKTVTLVDFSAS